MKRRILDTISQKENQLALLKSESNNALDLVTTTINNLSNINDQIDITVNEINDAKAKLQKTEDELIITRTHNNNIIKKFKQLIED